MGKINGVVAGEAEILSPVGEAGLGKEDGADGGAEAEHEDAPAPGEEQGAAEWFAGAGVAERSAEEPGGHEDGIAQEAAESGHGKIVTQTGRGSQGIPPCFDFLYFIQFLRTRSSEGGMRLRVAFFMEETQFYHWEILQGVIDYTQAVSCWEFVTLAGSLMQTWNRARHVRADGVLAPVSCKAHVEALKLLGAKVINYSNLGGAWGFVQVISDDGEIVKAGYEHLSDLGLSHLATFGNPRNLVTRVRAEAFRVLSEADGKRVVRIEYPEVRDEVAEWPLFLKRLKASLGKLRFPCGIFVTYGASGLKLAEACHESGLRVPGQVAILSVNTDVLQSGMLRTPLSYVGLNGERLGYEAARCLHQWLRTGRKPAFPVKVPPLGIRVRASTDHRAVSDPEVAACLRVLAERLPEIHGVDDLLALTRAAVSRRMLELKFTAALGRSPYQEILRARMRMARRLLEETRLRVHEIADRCGFADVRQFCVSFEKRTG
jgi:LacI family transcriptional regulator